MYTLRYLSALLPLILLPCSAQAQHRAAEARPRAVKTAVSEGHRAASLISAYRAVHGLKGVKVDAHLIRSAEHQARAVAQLGWLSHGDFAGRMASFGIRGKAAENLSAGLDSVDQVIAQWQRLRATMPTSSCPTSPASASRGQVRIGHTSPHFSRWGGASGL